MSLLQSAAAGLAKLLTESPSPIYVVDEDRRIVFCNQACARWTATAAGKLIGERCAYHSEVDDASPAAVAAQICPPPQTFCGEPRTAIVSCIGHGGQVSYRRGQFIPLSDGEDESAPVAAILESRDCLPDAPTVHLPSDERLHEQLCSLRRSLSSHYSTVSLLGAGPAMIRARAQVELAAQSGVPVFVHGPQGSGKNHAARAIHYRQQQPGALVPIACDLLDANLLRSILRAVWHRGAVIPVPDPTTLLLCNIDKMPAEAQSDLEALLRSDSKRARLIATSSVVPGELTSGRQFSVVLACMLTTLTIEMPPLFARPEDLPLLAQAFLERANREGLKQVGGFSHEALDRLAVYDWPGNVAELATVVEQAHSRAHGGQVTVCDLVEPIRWASEDALRLPRDESIVLEQFLARIERELIERAMRRAKGNKSKAAKLLGMTRPRLYRRLVQLALESPRDLP